MHVETLLHMANALVAALPTAAQPARVMTPDQLLTNANLDHINPFTLLQWANESKIVHKAAGHYAAASHPGAQPHQASRAPLYALLGFLRAIGSDAGEGCILINHECVRYVLLDAAAPFAELVQRAHSIILASGTLSPVDVLHRQLFAAGTASTITHHAFGHVVPQSNFITSVVTEGFGTARVLNFTYGNRQSALSALRVVIERLSAVVPNGMVVFFPSTRYMTEAVAAGVGGAQRKALFVEPADSGKTTGILADYAAACTSHAHGALLFSVCGGKLSEGINFSDEMGRCVVVVGLPYPDASSVEMQQRLGFAEQRGGAAAKKAVYDGACFKAVNQCIGRVLRHANDYAAVVLLDERYARNLDKLPRWVVEGGVVAGKGEVVVDAVGRFFQGKGERHQCCM